MCGACLPTLNRERSRVWSSPTESSESPANSCPPLTNLHATSAYYYYLSNLKFIYISQGSTISYRQKIAVSIIATIVAVVVHTATFPTVDTVKCGMLNERLDKGVVVNCPIFVSDGAVQIDYDNKAHQTGTVVVSVIDEGYSNTDDQVYHASASLKNRYISTDLDIGADIGAINDVYVSIIRGSMFPVLTLNMRQWWEKPSST